MDINCVFLGVCESVASDGQHCLTANRRAKHDLEKCSAFSIFAAKKTCGKSRFIMIKRSIFSQATNNIVRLD